MDLERLNQLQQKPPLFAKGQRQIAGEGFSNEELLFWDDAHISKQMLKSRLDPHTDAASYRPEAIDRSITWLVGTLQLGTETPVLDLGCGPGLYAARLAKLGVPVTGVDYSRRSIAYAKRQAGEQNLDVTYRYQDYLTLEDEDEYDVILLIPGDFCPLAPERRARLLGNIYRALKDGGHFVLDVFTPALRKGQRVGRNWYVAGDGFWRPDLHLVLEQKFNYPEAAVHLHQFIVIDPDGAQSVYRNWFQDFTPETISAELEQGGFIVKSIWGDLTGMPYMDGSEAIGVVAQKA